MLLACRPSFTRLDCGIGIGVGVAAVASPGTQRSYRLAIPFFQLTSTPSVRTIASQDTNARTE